jgi:hypothetical protein
MAEDKPIAGIKAQGKEKMQRYTKKNVRQSSGAGLQLRMDFAD